MNNLEKGKTRKMLECNNLSIVSSLGSQHAIEVKQNREHLKSIIEVLLFLAKQGLPLRGHDECAESKNRGNFFELIHFKAQDKRTLKDFIDNRKNYLSLDIQNELLDIIANQLIRKIVPKPLYAVIMDETLDKSHVEQITFWIFKKWSVKAMTVQQT